MVFLLMAIAAAAALAMGGAGDGGVAPADPGANDVVSKNFSDDLEMWARVGDAAERFYNEQATKDEKFVRQYRYGHTSAYDNNMLKGDCTRWGPGAGRMHANLTFAHVNVSRAELVAHEPMIVVEPRDNEGGANLNLQKLVQMGFISTIDAGKRIFADAAEDMALHSYARCYTNEENQMVLQDTYLRGMGVTKELFDTSRKLDRSDRLFRHEVYIDPHARHTVRQARYVVQTVVKPYEEARAMFKLWGIKIGEPNFCLADSPGMKQNASAESMQGEKDCYKFREFWIKDEERRVLRFQDTVSKEWIAKLDAWPCGPIETDDVPFSFLKLNAQGVFFNDAFSELEVIDELRAAYERLVQFIDEKTFRSMAPMIFIDESVSDDDVKAIVNSKTMEIRRVKNLAAGLKNFFAVLDLQTPNGPTMETAMMLKQLADEITGLDEILRGAQGREGMTAKEAAIRDDQAKSRTGLKLRALDNFFNSQLRHRLCIAHSRVPLETVERVCGYRARVVWSAMSGTMDDLLSEFAVGVGAGSSSQRQQREKIDRLERMRKSGHEENQARMAMGMPPKVDTLELLLEQARLDDNRNVERFLIPDPQPTPMGSVPGAAPGSPPEAGPGSAPVPMNSAPAASAIAAAPPVAAPVQGAPAPDGSVPA